ncbi:MAG: hypothetical protein F9K27_17590 [Anaerolineae bacterium]|nr:MAG: hypothetical protein F9K27_17590 [Anaerolineae bacterium]
MYDLHCEMVTFYDKYVHLSSDEQDKLRGYRDTNIERLEKGLTKLDYNTPVRTVGQGSYTMHTMVQHPDNDYDLDNAVIFVREDLPSDALGARQRVLAGVGAGGGNFKKPPEARTNAVTVWYAEGYHIDLAVYRCYLDMFGNEVIEHAGVEWTHRNPSEITDWFRNEVVRQSPSPSDGATVKEKQMRRVVQLLKMFAKSRSSWNLPGGLLISVLVAECYRPDWNRDDVAFYNTIAAIHTRLQRSTEILNPVDPSLKLTYKDEYINQVICFEEKLEQALDWLAPLHTYDCDEITAYRSWNKVFQHEYWSELVSGVELQNSAKFVTSTGTLHVARPAERSIQSPAHRFYGD